MTFVIPLVVIVGGIDKGGSHPISKSKWEVNIVGPHTSWHLYNTDGYNIQGLPSYCILGCDPFHSNIKLCTLA